MQYLIKITNIMFLVKNYTKSVLAPLAVLAFAAGLFVVLKTPIAEAATHYDCTPPYAVTGTADTATEWKWHCYYNSVSWGNPGYWLSEPKPAYSQPAYYSQPYYQATYYSQATYYAQGSYYSQGYYQPLYYTQPAYYAQPGYYSQPYYQGYYQSSYYSQPYYQAAYYSQPYYQGYYQSYYQGYYQSYYQATYYAQPSYVPMVSWTPTTVTIGEGDLMPTFGYNSTNATDGCKYEHLTPVYNLDWDYSVSAQNVSWPASSMLHYINSWTSRATCKSPAGTMPADLSVSVQKNNSAPVSVTGSAVVNQSSILNLAVTMQNTGTKQWNNDSTPHELCVATSSQPIWGNYCWLVATPTNNGGTFAFSVALPTPSTTGDFPLSFSMCEEGLRNESGSMYANGTCKSGVSGYFFGMPAVPPGGPGICDDTSSCPVSPGYVRVKNATLAVNPTGVTFPTNYAAKDPAILRTITIGNSGAGTIAAGTIGAYSAPFSGSTSFSSLAAGLTTSANVNFQSNATGTWNSGVDMVSGVQSKHVALIGTAVDMLTFGSGVSLDFGDANSAVGGYRNIVIKNNSTVTASGVMAITYAGVNPTNFSCFGTCSVASIPPGGTSALRFKFSPVYLAPGGTPINYTASVTFTFPARGIALPAALFGRGVPVKLQFNEK